VPVSSRVAAKIARAALNPMGSFLLCLGNPPLAHRLRGVANVLKRR
jgi:hypothetical protein